jgi:hypothetical protein
VERLTERLAVARRALGTLQEVLNLQHPSRVERDAAIQRFEYTCEAVWKAAQRYLQEVEGSALDPRKAVFVQVAMWGSSPMNRPHSA